MGRLSWWPAVLGLALAMIVVTLIEPTRNSLSYASGAIVLLSLLGWILEARAVAGPPEYRLQLPGAGSPRPGR